MYLPFYDHSSEKAISPQPLSAASPSASLTSPQDKMASKAVGSPKKALPRDFEEVKEPAKRASPKQLANLAPTVMKYPLMISATSSMDDLITMAAKNVKIERRRF